MLEPVKVALGEYMARFYAEIVPTTKPLDEFAGRGVARSIMWTPARMIDAAEEMLSLYARADFDDAPIRAFKMPIMFVAMAKDYTPSGRDFTRQTAESEYIALPGDKKGRAFGLRTVAADIRTQIVIAAMDAPTARALAAQFILYLDSVSGRRFKARYTFAGEELEWPVVVESPDAPAMNIQTEAKNVTLLAVDITLRATVPLFDAPKDGEANDGVGSSAWDGEDPNGYPVVAVVAGELNSREELDGASLGTWSVTA